MPVASAVVLNDFCHVQGGASRVAIDEAVALHAAGMEVTFLGAVGPVCDGVARRRHSRRSASISRNSLEVGGHRWRHWARCGTCRPTALRNAVLARVDPATDDRASARLHQGADDDAGTGRPPCRLSRPCARCTISSPRARTVRSMTTGSKSRAGCGRCRSPASRPRATSGIRCTKRIASRVAWPSAISRGFPPSVRDYISAVAAIGGGLAPVPAAGFAVLSAGEHHRCPARPAGGCGDQRRRCCARSARCGKGRRCWRRRPRARCRHADRVRR